MQYIITAYDFTDEDAINRRLANRSDHFVGIKRMINQGNFLSGGAILNGDGKMIGSSVHVSFDTRQALDSWIKNDPYTTGKVWQHVEIKEAMLVPVDDYLTV